MTQPDELKGEIQSNYETFRGTVPSEARALLPADFPFKIDMAQQDPLTGRYELGPFAMQLGLAALGRVDFALR